MALEDTLKQGWRVFQQDTKFIAEKSLALPGATSSILREEAATVEALLYKIAIREQFLGGDQTVEQKVVVTNDGSVVTDGQHEALKTDGVAVPDAVVPEPVVAEPVPGVEVDPLADVSAPGTTDEEPVPTTEDLAPEDVLVDGEPVTEVPGQDGVEQTTEAAPSEPTAGSDAEQTPAEESAGEPTTEVTPEVTEGGDGAEQTGESEASAEEPAPEVTVDPITLPGATEDTPAQAETVAPEPAPETDPAVESTPEVPPVVVPEPPAEPQV